MYGGAQSTFVTVVQIFAFTNYLVTYVPAPVDRDTGDNGAVTSGVSSYDDVNDIVSRLSTGLDQALGARLAGLYLTGSLSYGGFDHGSSDIDFIAVLTERLSPDDRHAVAARHDEIAVAHPRWAERIEGSYLARDLLGYDDPPVEPRPYVNGGGLWDPDPGYGQEWVLNKYVLHHCGIALVGPPAAEMFPSVSLARTREASALSFHQEWEPLLEDPAILDDPHHAAYITLTLCRILHTARVDGVASKRDAAAWVIETYGEPWAALVRAAECWRHGQPLPMAAQVLEFIRFVREQSPG